MLDFAVCCCCIDLVLFTFCGAFALHYTLPCASAIRLIFDPHFVVSGGRDLFRLLFSL